MRVRPAVGLLPPRFARNLMIGMKMPACVVVVVVVVGDGATWTCIDVKMPAPMRERCTEREEHTGQK